MRRDLHGMGKVFMAYLGLWFERFEAPHLEGSLKAGPSFNSCM